MADNNGRNYVVGVDMGGTKILAGVFDSRLQHVGTMKVSTKPQRGAEAALPALHPGRRFRAVHSRQLQLAAAARPPDAHA